MFFFTDIEGSTALLQRLGDRRYAEVLAEHQRLLRDAFAKGNGQEVDTQGGLGRRSAAAPPGVRGGVLRVVVGPSDRLVEPPNGTVQNPAMASAASRLTPPARGQT